MLDLNRVTTTCFVFSPTISAALTLASDRSVIGCEGGLTFYTPIISGSSPFAESTMVTMNAESREV